MDLYGRALVDIAIDLINGYLLCSQASTNVDMEVTAENGTKYHEKTKSRDRQKICHQKCHENRSIS